MRGREGAELHREAAGLAPCRRQTALLTLPGRGLKFPFPVHYSFRTFLQSYLAQTTGCLWCRVTTYQALALLGHNFPSWSAVRMWEGIQTAERTRDSIYLFF